MSWVHPSSLRPPWICLDRRLPWGLLSSLRSTGVSGLGFFLGVAVGACNVTFAVKRAVERNQKCSMVSVFHIPVGQWFPESPRRKSSLPDTSPMTSKPQIPVIANLQIPTCHGPLQLPTNVTSTTPRTWGGAFTACMATSASNYALPFIV